MSLTLPPEWTPQSGVMLTWPHDATDWADNLPDVEHCYGKISAAIAAREILFIVTRDIQHQQHITTVLSQHSVDLQQVRFAISDSDDTWARDHGPITVSDDGQLQMLDFTFNAWGNKFDSHKDNAINQTIAASFHAPVQSVDLVLEGGSIEVDGNGTLLTTRACLLSPERNPQLSETEIVQQLHHWFGVEQVLWLNHGHLVGDDTDSHIDTLARFCDANTIAYVGCEDSDDEHYADLKAMEDELKRLRNTAGQAYRLVPMPWAGDIRAEDGRRLAASYVNFLIINDAVLMPVYGADTDAAAIAALQTCFADREVIAIDCLPLIRQNGSLHCITMQLPQGVL